MKKPLIHIVDDDAELVESFTLLLQTMGWEVASYASGQAFLDDASLEGPGCIVLDMRMPGMTGLEVQEELEKRACRIPILFLSAHGSISIAVQAVQHGAVDFLEKPVDPFALVQKISQAVTLSIERMAQDSQTEEFRNKFTLLTPREKDVIREVLAGAQNKEAARNLGLEVSTIKMHRANAFAKLGVHSQSELIKLAFKSHILDAKKNHS